MAYYKYLLYNEAYYVLCGHIMRLIIRKFAYYASYNTLLYAYYTTHNVQGFIIKVIMYYVGRIITRIIRPT